MTERFGWICELRRSAGGKVLEGINEYVGRSNSEEVEAVFGEPGADSSAFIAGLLWMSDVRRNPGAASKGLIQAEIS
jgi:hypothetical protein